MTPALAWLVRTARRQNKFDDVARAFTVTVAAMETVQFLLLTDGHKFTILSAGCLLFFVTAHDLFV